MNFDEFLKIESWRKISYLEEREIVSFSHILIEKWRDLLFEKFHQLLTWQDPSLEPLLKICKERLNQCQFLNLSLTGENLFFEITVEIKRAELIQKINEKSKEDLTGFLKAIFRWYISKMRPSQIQNSRELLVLTLCKYIPQYLGEKFFYVKDEGIFVEVVKRIAAEENLPQRDKSRLLNYISRYLVKSDQVDKVNRFLSQSFKELLSLPPFEESLKLTKYADEDFPEFRSAKEEFQKKYQSKALTLKHIDLINDAVEEFKLLNKAGKKKIFISTKGSAAVGERKIKKWLEDASRYLFDHNDQIKAIKAEDLKYDASFEKVAKSTSNQFAKHMRAKIIQKVFVRNGLPEMGIDIIHNLISKEKNSK